MEKNPRLSEWAVFKRSVPWRDITLGFLVPKIIFYISMNKPWLFAGVLVSMAWCIGLFLIQYLRSRRINWWALAALAMILIQMMPVLVKNDPNMNFIAGALGNLLLGAVFLVSILIRKPIIQVFAEKAGARAQVPDAILQSPYYGKAWAIVTAAWAAVYIAEAAVLLLLVLNRSEAVIFFDVAAGWPTVVLMIFFSVKFPALYWKAVAAKAGFAGRT